MLKRPRDSNRKYRDGKKEDYRVSTLGDIVVKNTPEVIKEFWDAKGYQAERDGDNVLKERFWNQAENWLPNKLKDHLIKN